MYSDFLSLCGFDPEETKREEKRIDRAFSIFGIESEDIKHACERINAYFDVELYAIRKILGVWLGEFVDLVLAREEGKKIVYASMPPSSQFLAAISSASDDIYCTVPEIVLGTVMGSIFGNTTPILEAGERSGLPPGNAFCTFLQTRLGAITLGKIPIPDLAVPSCLYCDHSPKVDELLHEIYGVPVIYIDHVFEDKGEQWPHVVNSRRSQYMARNMKDAAKEFEHLFGHPIRKSRARELFVKEANLAKAARSLSDLMNVDPAPISLKDLKAAQELSSVCSRRCLREGVKVFRQLERDLKDRVRKGLGRVEKGAPRIMFSIPPFDPEIIEMVEKMGLAISMTSLFAPTPRIMIEIEYHSLWEEIADSTLRRRAAAYSSLACINRDKGLVKQYDLDGVILFHHIGCRQLNNYLPGTRDRIEKDLGIPVLILEGDFIDSRYYSAQQMRNRLEAFSHVVKSEAVRRRRKAHDVRRG
jgi:benzoyl-CoA reductase/2-hydroxyglutaryl-CoA dehydratase subunit BcrC/BadD/HgdB